MNWNRFALVASFVVGTATGMIGLGVAKSQGFAFGYAVGALQSSNDARDLADCRQKLQAMGK